jgi:hypothetical protein
MFPVQSVENIELQKWSDHEEIWSDTIKQINKDIHTDFPVLNLSELKEVLGNYLAQTNQLMEHLYRIDLPQQIYLACHVNHNLDTSLLAEWIVKREMYKVLFRRQYNG